MSAYLGPMAAGAAPEADWTSRPEAADAPRCWPPVLCGQSLGATHIPHIVFGLQGRIDSILFDGIIAVPALIAFFTARPVPHKATNPSMAAFFTVVFLMLSSLINVIATAVFKEPLGANRAFALYRCLTPAARTADKHPLLPADQRIARTVFSRSDWTFFGLSPWLRCRSGTARSAGPSTGRPRGSIGWRPSSPVCAGSSGRR